MERAKRAQSRSRSHLRDPREAAPASVAVAVVVVAAASASSTTFPRRQRAASSTRVGLRSAHGPPFVDRCLRRLLFSPRPGYQRRGRALFTLAR